MNTFGSKRPPDGAVGVIVHQDGRLLVIERAATVRAPGRLCFPGGGVEDGETEQEAVERELHEELGIAVRAARRLWQSETEFGVLLSWWLLSLLPDQVISPNPDEVAHCFWMEQDEIAAHPDTLQSNREFLAAVRRGEVDIK